jgi:maleylacetoacetate isomerase/maleylpyruvate isomerase
MKLFSYFRSSASFRVRIALHYKGLDYDYIPVHLVRGEHHDPAYTGRVGDALVPTLLTDDGVALSQSMAIIEYLDETHPAPPLLPAEPLARAQVRALAQMVACEMHPLGIGAQLQCHCRAGRRNP